MNSRNVIALDVGERRVGVAIANLNSKIARPLLTIDCIDNADVYKTISEILKSEHADTIVIGLPRNLDSDDTPQTKIVRDFATELSDTITTIQIYLIDEAGTSVKAIEELESKGSDYSKGDIDKLAACYILEDWLGQQTEV